MNQLGAKPGQLLPTQRPNNTVAKEQCLSHNTVPMWIVQVRDQLCSLQLLRPRPFSTKLSSQPVSATVSALTSPLPAPLLLGILISTTCACAHAVGQKRHSMALTCLLTEVRVNPHPGPSPDWFLPLHLSVTRTLDWLSLQKGPYTGETVQPHPH